MIPRWDVETRFDPTIAFSKEYEGHGSKPCQWI
jgi:hypothetical protein